VAGQRELAPPSKFSKEGGFRKSVFRGFIAVVKFITQGAEVIGGRSPEMVPDGT
jgi:hypothetical protein